jgi:hypothetical protein
VQNNKDYFDQSLDEVKLLRAINAADPHDAHGILRLYDFFYYRVRTSRAVPLLTLMMPHVRHDLAMSLGPNLVQ